MGVVWVVARVTGGVLVEMMNGPGSVGLTNCTNPGIEFNCVGVISGGGNHVGLLLKCTGCSLHSVLVVYEGK